jgi:hypothetical protein
MRLIAFAHLTVSQIAVNEFRTRENFRTFNQIHNPKPKRKAMTSGSEYHDISIIRGNFDLEIINYSNNTGDFLSNISDDMLSEFDTNSEIRSSSFSAEFFSELTSLLGMRNYIVSKSIKFRTLNQMKMVTLVYDENYPPFREHIDLPGMGSIAFYASNLNIDQSQSNDDKMTRIFRISLGDNLFMIRFVKCGEVWIELIQRL